MYSLRSFARLSLSAAKPSFTRSSAANSFLRSAPVQLSPIASRSFQLSRALFEEKAPAEKATVVEDAAAVEEVLTDSKADVRAASDAVQSTSEEAVQAGESFVSEQVKEETSASSQAAEEAAAADIQARTVFVGGVSWNLDNEWLKDEVVKALGTTAEGVNGVRIARNPMGKSKGFGFIELATPELAQQLATIEGIEIDGRQPNFQLSSSRPTASGQQRPVSSYIREGLRERPTTPRNPPSNTVWAGNVAWSVEQDQILDTFSQFGTISRVALPIDSVSGRSRGIAYIEFETVADAQKAVDAGFKEQGVVIDGRPVRLDFASVKNEGGRRTYIGKGGRGGQRGGQDRGEQRTGYGSRRHGGGGQRGERREGGDRRERGERRGREEW